MDEKQWFVLGSIFILASFLSIFVSLFFGGNQDCVEGTFGNFADTYNNSLSFDKSLGMNSFYKDYAYNEYNLIQCAVEEKIYDVSYSLFNQLTWFLAIVFFIMGGLEPKQKH